jgi:hypothetical protein
LGRIPAFPSHAYKGPIPFYTFYFQAASRLYLLDIRQIEPAGRRKIDEVIDDAGAGAVQSRAKFSTILTLVAGIRPGDDVCGG